MTTAAILYQQEGYDTSSQRLMGRHAASEGFLKALSAHSSAESLYCYTPTRPEFEAFCQQVQPWLSQPRPIRWIPGDRPYALSEPGILYRPDPAIPQMAWQRRYLNQRGYSLCGITHTMVSKEMMALANELLTAPLQPWDAVICTSTAVKTMLENQLEHWADYYSQRFGGRPSTQVQLPVIPLGVDGAAFLQGEAKVRSRQQMRQQYGIGPDDRVVLFVGRLIFHAKAHPVPMYLALEQAAQAVTGRVHVLQVGWFEDAQQEAAFKQAAAEFCPSVTTTFIDGRDSYIRQHIWSAADVFVSLADNVQETFGLTPVEAMAAGVPVVVSDWNGYKDTVRSGVDGFRIPTVTPPPGCGMDLAVQYNNDQLNYSTYVGYASLMTAVDVDACARALVMLFNDPELRQRMGENGRQQVRDRFDWSVVMAQYEALWQELTELRQAAPEEAPVAPNQPPHPGCDDPYRLLAHYPTQHLQAEHVLTLGPMAQPESLQRLENTWMVTVGAERRAPMPVVKQVLEAIAQAGSLSVAAILNADQATTSAQRMYLHRTLVYLLKFDVLRLVQP